MKRSTTVKISLLFILLIGALFLCACDEECSHEHMSETLIKPTHEEEGKTTFMCLDCDYMYHTDYVAPVGHAMRKETHTPTCTEEGYTYNYCECGYYFTNNQVPPTGHTLSVEEVTAPTCKDEGRTVVDCSVCGHHYEYPTAPLGHDLNIERTFVSVNNQAASSTYTCSRCDLNYVGDYVFYHDIYEGAYVENTEVLAKGVDVSYHQHDKTADGEYLPLDWATIKAQGYDFAILRAGYMGSGNVGVTDKVYEMNYKDARAAGLDLGVYFFSYAYTTEDAKAEAEFLLTLLEGKTFEYPIFFDIEYSDQKIAEKGLTPTELTDICCTFINILQENGYYAALYTNNKWLTEHLYKEKITTLFDVWYARYASNDIVINEDTWNTESFGKQMGMWQFSHTGTIDGIYRNFATDENGEPEYVAFDLNYAYKDYPTLIKSLGYNGFSLGEAENEAQPQ